MASVTFINTAVIAVWIVVILFFVRLIRNATRDIAIPPVLRQEGFTVPVWNAYLGGIWFNVHNGLYPQFKLFENHFEGRVLISKKYSYETIKTVAVVKKFWLPRTLTILFTDGSWNFNVNMNKHNLQECLRFFQNRGFVLTEQALRFIN